MGYTISWTETEQKDTAQPVTTVHTKVVDDANEQVQANLDGRFAALWGNAVSTGIGTMLVGLEMGKARPRFIPPAPFAVMPSGQLLTLGPNGEVYSDGIRLGGSAAQLIVQVGTTVLLLGKTIPKWWKWTGTAWFGPLAEVDLTLLTPPPPTP